MAVASVRLRALSDNVAYAAGLDARLLGMILVLLAIWFGFDILTGGASVDTLLQPTGIETLKIIPGSRNLIGANMSFRRALFDEIDGFRSELREAAGVAPAFAIESFTDLDADVRQSILRVRRSTFLLHRDAVRGFVYDVATHQLREIRVDGDG